MKKRKTLKVKVVFVMLLFTILLSAITILSSYQTYSRSFKEHYENLASSISKTTASVVPAEKVKKLTDETARVFREICEENGDAPNPENYSDEQFEEYYSRFEHITQMPEYTEILSLLEALREDNDVRSLYIGFTDTQTMKDLYIVDASEGVEPCVPGDFDDVNPEHIEKIKNGNYDFPPFVTNLEEYGWLCSAYIPITDDEGNVVGAALTDISMNKIMSDINMFLVKMTSVVAIIALLMFVLILCMTDRAILKPINKLSRAASGYLEAKKQRGGREELLFESIDIKTGDEIENLFTSVKQMEKDINLYINELTSVTAEKERIGAELDIATKIQASMLPCIFPAFPERDEFEVYATMTPAKEVGGDFYDFFMVDEDNLAIVMADVSGKGVPAALFMVIGKTLIKDHTTSGRDLGEVFTEVNQLLCESNSEELFITAFVGVLNLKTGNFRYVNAGHEIPFIAKKGEKFEPYKIRAAFVLAGMEGMKYKSGEMQLEPGDKLFQYTDGVTEATNKDNQLYGMGRLETTLSKLTSKSATEILEGVKADIDEFVDNAPQFDDITMLCLEYHGTQENSRTVDLSIDNIVPLTEFIESTLQSEAVSKSVITKMNIALDEIYSNIVKFSGATYAKITCNAENGMAYLRFEDDGIPYNPLTKDDADITLAVEEREIGGLGILMVKKSMDNMEYEYTDSKNILVLTKKYD